MCIYCVIETRAKNNDKFLVASLFCFQSGQSRSEEEDETVDVESYGDEPTTAANSAMNLAASQNNNNITKIDSIRPTMRPMPFPGTNVGGGIGIGGVISGNSNNNSSMPNDDHMITSRNSIWQTHTKHGHRLGNSPPGGAMGATNLTLANSIPSIGCGPPPPPPSTLFSSESGATPTSSDQINDYDRAVDSPNRTMPTSADRLNAARKMNDIQKNCSARELKNSAETTHNSCDNDNDEEVIVTNDDDECHKKMPSTKDLKRSDKNR